MQRNEIFIQTKETQIREEAQRDTQGIRKLQEHMQIQKSETTIQTTRDFKVPAQNILEHD